MQHCSIQSGNCTHSTIWCCINRDTKHLRSSQAAFQNNSSRAGWGGFSQQNNLWCRCIAKFRLKHRFLARKALSVIRREKISAAISLLNINYGHEDHSTCYPAVYQNMQASLMQWSMWFFSKLHDIFKMWS